MKRYELEVEHHYKNKFVGRHAIKGNSYVTVLGSAPIADIRLLGQDVSQVHAYLEFDGSQWYLIDANSEQGTWVAKKPIQREQITENFTVNIGGHQLKLKPREIQTDLFATEKSRTDRAETGTNYHQVIVRKKGVVIHTYLLGENETFKYHFDGKDHELKPPANDQFVETQFGDFTVQQRIARSTQLRGGAGAGLGGELRTPLMVALAMIIAVVTLIVAMPKGPNKELAAPALEDNKFTKMVVDANLMKKKREEARERQKQLARKPSGQAAQGSGDPKTTPVKSKGDAPKVVNQIKTAGLSSLLAKISKRATASGPKIFTQGEAADSGRALGRASAVAQVGSMAGVGTQAGNGGETFRIGGVGTVGKGGGGKGNLAGMGGLAAGGAGSASVGILEEETEIEGGLDKDVIARVIQSQLGEIRYCYERQLSAEPDIYGKVLVRFTIDANGSVSAQKVGLTTLRSAMVEGCILRRVANWKFPKPKGGTTVLVTYPFLFKSTN